MTPKETDVFDNNNCQANTSTFYDFFDAYNEGPACGNCDRGKKKNPTKSITKSILCYLIIIPLRVLRVNKRHN